MSSKPTVDFTLVKPANTKTTYTPHQVREIQKCMTDPLYFMEKYMWIQHPVKGKIPFIAYEYQKRLVEAYWKNTSVVALLPRQTGKTTTAAGYLLWYAMFNDDVTILIAANKFRAATEIMDRIKFAYEELPDWLRAGAATYNVQDIKFDNGSRIKSTTTTPDSGRGMSISLLYLDEFAFVKPRIAEEFWTAMSPTLSTGGKCIITSTPNSDEDKFAEIWFGANKTIDDHGDTIPDGVGVNGFKAITAHYSEVPGRDDAWATRERAKIGADKFDREYDCKFLTADETLINAVTLLKLQGVEPMYKTNDIRWYDKIKPNNTYVLALDPSAGVGKDFAAI